MFSQRLRIFHLLFMGACLNFLTGAANPSADLWDAFLVKYLDAKTGKVKYQQIAKDGQPSLQKIIDSYGSLNVSGMSDGAKRANYINFYNAGMIYNILKYAKEKKIDVGSKDFLALQINDLKV